MKTNIKKKDLYWMVVLVGSILNSNRLGWLLLTQESWVCIALALHWTCFIILSCEPVSKHIYPHNTTNTPFLWTTKMWISFYIGTKCGCCSVLALSSATMTRVLQTSTNPLKLKWSQPNSHHPRRCWNSNIYTCMPQQQSYQ
jgi:hypothetical protein